MTEPVKRWARARMAPSTWTQLTDATTRLAAEGRAAVTAARGWVSFGTEHATSFRSARIDPWRVVLAIISVALPALALALLTPDLHFGLPAILLLSVAFSTYVADWFGGATALFVGTLCLDLVFADPELSFTPPDSPQSLFVLVVYLAAGASLIGMIEHLKHDRASARLEAAAMRAGNAALSAVELAAASRPAGDVDAYFQVLDSLLTAMVRVNRASVGALYLVDDSRTRLVRVAAYGEIEDAPPVDAVQLPIEQGFGGRLARERRPALVHQFNDDAEVEDVVATNPHLRSVAGVPLIDASDRVIGVAWVGLYVRHHFSPTTVARLEALAHRAVAFLEAAKLADAQEELLDRVQYHHRRLQAVIQTMPEAVMVVRPPHGTIVTSNAAAQRMFGIPPSAYPFMMRASQLSVRSADGGNGDDQPIVRAMAHGETVTGAELVVVQGDGSELPVIASAAPLHAEDGSLDAVVGVFQDVRPLKDAQRLRDEFISIVSHELRSPLTPIRGFAQLVARDIESTGGDRRHVEWLRILQRHADRMTRLIDDLLDVSRLRAGRLETRPDHVDVVEICQGVVSSRQTTTSDHTIGLTTEHAHIDAVLDGDRIYQVIDNLVGNAIKYTEKGTIRVELTLPDTQPETLSIRVSDEGSGISRSDRESLFSPFYRSKQATDSAVPGLGLGLFICRELIVAHGGQIEVSDAPGGGASFTVVLPTGVPTPQRLSA